MCAEQSAKKLTRLLPLPTIRDIMQMYKVRASRRLSQNFLLNEALNHKIVKSAGKIKQAEVCEVGPGPGNITRSIIHKGAERVIVIEKDPQFLPTLEMLKSACPVPFEIIHGDILRYNFEKTFSESKRKPWEDKYPDIHIIGNLPFNVATPLIIRWIRDISLKQNAWSYGRVRLTLTFQKEVAERMVAPVMTAQRCKLSVMCQNWCFVDYKFTIPGKAFLPKPDVDVGVVHFKPHINPIIPLPFVLIEKVVKAMFTGRQKFLNNSLKNLFPELKQDLAVRMLEESEIHPKTRAMQLSVEEIGRLCFSYDKIIKEEPSLRKYDHHKTKDDSSWQIKEEEEEHKLELWKRKQIEDEFY
ncbi:dimethyladenosine transferase 1, mitochondrial [Planococcus citri]|uniref:dimethyladenosine transferase 1, mitochondrial n=1 Tax=Planococcus citri TaxID=170843 RepID=UPI0031F856B7